MSRTHEVAAEAEFEAMIIGRPDPKNNRDETINRSEFVALIPADSRGRLD